MPLTYGVKLHVEKNFNRDCGSPLGDLRCQYLLSSLNVVSDDVWWYWLVLLASFLFFCCTGLFLLRRSASTLHWSIETVSMSVAEFSRNHKWHHMAFPIVWFFSSHHMSHTSKSTRILLHQKNHADIHVTSHIIENYTEHVNN
jgi:hypothetical protein